MLIFILGASSDFKTATALAYSMVTKWGMSDKVGFIHHTPERKISPEQRQLIDAEVKHILDERYKFAKQVSFFFFGFWFLVFGFWFLVFGFWFLVFGFWFLVFGFCLL
jgi:hypothetical protein